MSSRQVKYIVDKFYFFKNTKVILYERGTVFRSTNVVVDMLGINIMLNISGDYSVIVDVTHSFKIRDALSPVSGRSRLQIFDLSKSSIVVGVAELFIEAHPDLDEAKCDGSFALLLTQLKPFSHQIKVVDDLIKSF